MTPDDFVRSIAQKPPAPAYLFLGPETYSRERCRRALVERVLTAEDRAEGVTRHDLDEVDLHRVLDDARSFSLFASARVMWVSSAEAALPRRMSSAGEDEEGKGGGTAAGLADWISNPVPDVTVVFDCSRYDFEGDDKAKLQRVQKFYSAISAQVEFVGFTPFQARKLAEEQARERGLKIRPAETELLVDVLGPDAARIVNEIEKLALYCGSGRAVTADDIMTLVPNAQASTIFTLVNAMARNDRTASLDSLDLLIREGEYLPLALSFLGTQFRLALVAKEAKLSSSSQVQQFFSKGGTPMWKSRADQVAQTAGAFTLERLRVALKGIYETDKALRDTRPDDRTVMEQLVFKVTSA